MLPLGYFERTGAEAAILVVGEFFGEDDYFVDHDLFYFGLQHARGLFGRDCDSLLCFERWKYVLWCVVIEAIVCAGEGEE